MMNALRRKVRRRCPLYLTPEEHEGLRAAGRFNGQVLDHLRAHVRPGVTTNQLDQLAHEYIVGNGNRPACLGYKGYPKTICTSINEVVCHGIPDGTVLRDGDIVNVDVTSIVDGWYGDSSEMFLVGNVGAEARRLVQITFDSLHIGIAAAQPYAKLVDVGRAIERYARAHNVDVVQEYQGHGIGREFHQEPGVPHYVPQRGQSPVVLEPGLCFTIEPMLNAGTWRTFVDSRDNWTVRTMDMALSAQFEHTILITESGPEILTLTEQGPQVGHKF